MNVHMYMYVMYTHIESEKVHVLNSQWDESSED